MLNVVERFVLTPLYPFCIPGLRGADFTDMRLFTPRETQQQLGCARGVAQDIQRTLGHPAANRVWYEQATLSPVVEAIVGHEALPLVQALCALSTFDAARVRKMLAAWGDESFHNLSHRDARGYCLCLCDAGLARWDTSQSAYVLVRRLISTHLKQTGTRFGEQPSCVKTANVAQGRPYQVIL